MNNNISRNFTYNNADIFTEICRPIFDTSPITFCSIGRIFNDGTFTALWAILPGYIKRSITFTPFHYGLRTKSTLQMWGTLYGPCLIFITRTLKQKIFWLTKTFLIITTVSVSLTATKIIMRLPHLHHHRPKGSNDFLSRSRMF